MIRSASIALPADLKPRLRAANAARAALRCDSAKRRGWREKMGFDYFTTTLSISPLKDAQCLNQIGGTLAERFGVQYLFSDFKKRTVIDVRVHCPSNMGCIVRTIAAAYFPGANANNC